MSLQDASVIEKETPAYFNYYRYRDGSYYFGTAVGEEKSGIGLMNLNRRGFYEGEWLRDCFHGIGLFMKPNRLTYFGEFAGGVMDGLGRILYEGHSYFGEFRSGFKTGLGEYTSVQGTKIFGYFSNGRLEGYGEIFDSVNDDLVSGYFKDGLLNGLAVRANNYGKIVGVYKHGLKEGIFKVFDSHDCLKSVGRYVKGQQKGFTAFTSEDGTLFEGCMFENKKDGFGREVLGIGSSRYVGFYENGERKGFGKLETQESLYIGSWNKGKPDGIGYQKWHEKGESYFGGWKNGLKHGVGYENMNGKEYKGEFFEGKYHGYAIVKLPTKESKNVLFRAGKLTELVREQQCEFLKEYTFNFKAFLEEAKGKVRDLEGQIEFELQEVNIDAEAIEVQMAQNHASLTNRFNKERLYIEGLRDRFDVFRITLSRKVEQLGIKYDNIFIHDIEFDKIRKFHKDFGDTTIQCGYTFNNAKAPKELDEGSKISLVDQSLISIENELDMDINPPIKRGGSVEKKGLPFNRMSNHTLTKRSQNRLDLHLYGNVQSNRQYKSFATKRLEDIVRLCYL